MGFFEDLEKSLDNFIDWLGDWEFEEPEEEYEEPEYEYEDDDFFAPIADFFTNLDKGTDEMVTDFVGELLGKEKEDEKLLESLRREEWFEYFGHIGRGYWGTQKIPSSEKTYFSKSQNMKEEIKQMMIDEFGERFLGFGESVPPDVSGPYPVGWDEVDEDNII